MLCVLPNERLACVVRDALAPAALVFASDGGEALAAIYRGPFDAYVLDYWLPDWTGVNLCREIRKSDPHVPICFFTNAHRADAARKALRAGADVYLDATAGAKSLRNRVESLMLVRESQLLQAGIEEERAIEE